jgi:ferredoxin
MHGVIKTVLLASLLWFVSMPMPAVVHALTAADDTPQVTLAGAACHYHVRAGDLAEALGLSRQVDKHRTLKELGIGTRDLETALKSVAIGETEPRRAMHRGAGRGLGGGAGRGYGAAGQNGTQGHQERQVVRDAYCYLLWPVLLGGMLWWLLRGGRFEDGRLLPVTKRYAPLAGRATLLLVVLFFGFASGKSPNPMEALVKYFKALAGFYEGAWKYFGVLMFFTLLSIVGNKLICGWGCPLGALQELLYDLPLVRRRNRLRLPFRWTMLLRTLLFGGFLVFTFGLFGRKWVLYHGINPFNLFGFGFDLLSIGAVVVAVLLLAPAVYRPFCQLVCPFGWYAWFFEKASLTGIRIDHDRCIGCGACDRACPVEAAGDRLSGKSWPAECYSCARCLRVCPVDAIDYGPRWRQKSEPSGE